MKLSLLPWQHLEPVAQQVALEPRGASGVVVVVDEHAFVGWCLHHSDYYCVCAISHRWAYIPVLPWLSCHHNHTHTTHTFYRTRPP